MTLRLIIMGVMGAGKTTLARALSEDLQLAFIDADDHHPPANRTKMAAGIALTDEDRAPWLEALSKAMREHKGGAVLACSALKQSYRDLLEAGAGPLHWIWLDAPQEVIAARLAKREGHFANPTLLQSQFETLEAPQQVLRLAAAAPIARHIDRVRDYLKTL